MFKDRLKEARKMSGLSQERLGAIIGVSKQTVSDYERGYSEPDMNKIMQIMSALNVDANFLWQDEMSEPEGKDRRLSSAALRVAEIYDKLDDHGRELLDVVADLQKKRVRSSGGWQSVPLINPTAHDADVYARYTSMREVQEITDQTETVTAVDGG